MPMQFDSGGYKPQYELSALYGGQENAMAEDAHNEQMMKEKIANFLAAQKAPNELAVSDLQGAQAQAQNTQPMLDAFTRGKTGEYGQHEAAGRKALGTVNSDIKASNQKNESDIMEKQATDFLRGAELYMGADGNPFALNGQISPELLQKYSQLKQSGQLGTVVEGIKKRLADSVAQRQAVSLQTQKDLGDLARTNATVAGNKSIEKMRINAGKYAKANSDKITIFTSKLKPEVQLAQINASLTGNKDPVTGEQLDEAGKNFWTMYGQSLGASAELKVRPQEGVINVPQVSGLPAVATPQAIVPGAPTQQATPQAVDPLGIRK